MTKIYDYPTILALATFMRHEAGACAPTSERINLEEVLHRVQQGHLEVAQAYQLLQQIGAS